MNEPNRGDPGDGGWTAGRVLGMIIGVLGLVGFGFCSLCALVVGATDRQAIWGIILPFAIPGLVVAVAFFFLVRSIYRGANPRRRDPPNP